MANIRGNIKEVQNDDLKAWISSYSLGIPYVQAKEAREAWQWRLYVHSLMLSVRVLHE